MSGGGGSGGPPESDLTAFLRAHPFIGILLALACFAGAFWTFIKALMPTLSTFMFWALGIVVGLVVLYGLYWLWFWTRPPKDFPHKQDDPRR